MLAPGQVANPRQYAGSRAASGLSVRFFPFRARTPAGRSTVLVLADASWGRLGAGDRLEAELPRERMGVAYFTNYGPVGRMKWRDVPGSMGVLPARDNSLPIGQA